MVKFNFNVKPIRDGELNIVGKKPVRIIVFESTQEGEIIKICTEDDYLGVFAEYAWINYKYPGYMVAMQALSTMKLNGKDVECDILTIENERSKKDIFIDISDFLKHDIPHT
jgi:hypothetical protein